MKHNKSNIRMIYLYMAIGILTPIIIFIYYLNDMACGKAVASQIIITVVSIVLGVFSIQEINKMKKPVARMLSAIYLLPWIIIVPINMISNWGLEKFLEKRLIAATTIDIFAIVQIIIAVIVLIQYKKTESSS